jgi:PilZ domain
LGAITKAAIMDGNEKREIARDSLFVMVDVRLDGSSTEHRVKMRNLSAGGMMGEGDVKVSRGAVVFINIRNLGWIEGLVAWVQDNRFGVAFRDDIDPIMARAPIAAEMSPARTSKAAATGAAKNALRKL